MLQTQRQPLPAERLDRAGRLATEGRADDLRAYADLLRAEHAVGADDELLLFTLLAVAHLNTEHFADAKRTLAQAEPLVAAASRVRQARYQSVAGRTAHGLHDPERAVDRVVRALALVDCDTAPSADLCVTLGNCGTVLAGLQLFPLAGETAARGIEAAAAGGLPVSLPEIQAAYPYLAWAMQLEHLGLDEQGRERWTAAVGHLDNALASDALPALFRATGAAWRAICTARLGRVEEGWRSLGVARRLPPESPSPIVARAMEHARAALLLAEGRLGEARAVLLAIWGPTTALDQPLWIEDVAWLLGRTAAAAGDDAEALRWHREVHQRYGRAQYESWLSRATAARLRIEQEALVRRARQLESDALSDPLTGVPNRRAFDTNLPRLVATAHLAGAPLSLAVIDIDHFKQVNDTHGHPVGDEVLRRIARVLREQSREVDRCARYGGDELVLCLPLAAPEASAVLARLARAVAEHPWSAVAPGLAVTVSTGVAELRPGDTPTTLFWAADQSLLTAKRARGARAAEHPAGIPAARTASARS